MSIRLPFIDRIKMLTLGFINGQPLTLHPDRYYEIEVLPSPTQRGSQHSPLSSVHMIEPASSIAALASSNADRFWSANLNSSRDMRHTHSNLS